MRSYFVVVAILLAMAGVVAASEQEHLPASIMRDVAESMGNAALSSSEDSIEVVNHFAPSADRSLIHAAESITHELDDKMEEASYSELPDYIVPSSSKMEEAQYNEAIDPAFLLETGAHSDLEEVELLDSVEAKAHTDAQEMDIGLIEESACQGPACHKPAPKQYVTPVYKNRPRKHRRHHKHHHAPKNATGFVVPHYKPSRKHHHKHHHKAAAAKPKGDGWKVAPILPHGSIVVDKHKRHAARKAKAARYITAAIKPDTPAVPAKKKHHKRRYCVKRNVQTKKCERRCRRCRGRKPKQYISPSFYISKPKHSKRRGFPAGTKVLVNTPAGPVYVLYVKKHHKPKSHHISGLAYHQAPRAVVRAAGATYVLPHAPASPYQRDYKEIRRARRRARRAARRARRHAQINTVYDPKTNTVVRHIHNHHFTRASDVETTTSAPTLRRAYVKLCKLQRAIMTKYNKEALPSARVLSRAARVALKYDTKADQSEAEANALRKKYADHLKKYRKAQKLINRANRWLKRRGHRTSKKRSLRSRCRRAARKAGRKVPSRCARRHRRRAHKTSRKVFNKNRYDPITNKVRFQAMNADSEAETETESEADAEAEAETESESETETEAESETESESEAETETEAETEAETEIEATTEQTAEQTAEAKAEAELQTEAQDAAFSPVEGLDFNRSPLIDALIQRLDAKELVKA